MDAYRLGPVNILFIKKNTLKVLKNASQLARHFLLSDKNSYFWVLTRAVSWRPKAKVLFDSMLYRSLSVLLQTDGHLGFTGNWSVMMKHFFKEFP